MAPATEYGINWGQAREGEGTKGEGFRQKPVLDRREGAISSHTNQNADHHKMNDIAW
jgi:hypothetical protein